MPAVCPASCCYKAMCTRRSKICTIQDRARPGSSHDRIRQDFNNICASTGVTTQNCSPATIAGMVVANPSLIQTVNTSGYVPGRQQLLLQGQHLGQLLLRHLRQLRRQLSGHAARIGQDCRPIHCAWHLRDEVRLLHVLRSTRQFDAHLDERRRRQLRCRDGEFAAGLQFGRSPSISITRFRIRSTTRRPRRVPPARMAR